MIIGLTRRAYVVKCSYMATSTRSRQLAFKAIPFVTQELARRPLEQEKVKSQPRINMWPKTSPRTRHGLPKHIHLNSGLVFKYTHASCLSGEGRPHLEKKAPLTRLWTVQPSRQDLYGLRVSSVVLNNTRCRTYKELRMKEVRVQHALNKT